jgi:hypothetical protein
MIHERNSRSVVVKNQQLSGPIASAMTTATHTAIHNTNIEKARFISSI